MVSILLALALGGCAVDSYTIVLNDAENFLFESSIAAESQVIAAGEDTSVDWSGLDVTLLGEPLDPTADILRMQIARFGEFAQEDVLSAINNDELNTADVSGFVLYDVVAGETSAMLSEFCLIGTCVDPATDLLEDMGTFLVSAVHQDGSYAMFSFFEPTDGAPVVPIELVGDSAVLSYTVDLDAGEPIDTPKAKAYAMNWADLTTNGSGRSFELSNIDTMLLGRYELSLEDLEADFLNVETLADELYRADLGGEVEIDLGEIESEDGEPFAGFTGKGTWLVALQCSTCINPSPPFLGIIK